MSLPRVWSPTQIATWRSCPRQWHELYDGPGSLGPGSPERTSAPPRARPIAIRRGIAVHAGLEAAYRAVSGSGLLYAPHVTMSRYADTAQEAFMQRVAHDPYPWPEDVFAAAEDRLHTVLDRLPAPHFHNVLGVEVPLFANLPSGRTERGIADLVLRTGPTSAHIRDWKWPSLTALPRRHELARSDQLPFYRAGAARLWPFLTHVTVGLYSITDAREVVAECTVEDAEYVLGGHDAIADRAEVGPYPATPDGNNCARCPVRDGCPEWSPAP